MNREEFVKNVGKLFDTEVLKMREERDGGPSEFFRMSGIASCPRQSMFGLLNLPKDQYPIGDGFSAKSIKLMRRGTDDHAFIQSVLIHMGLMTEQDLEGNKHIWFPDKLISGHPDGILTFDNGERVLLELKTINGRGYQYIREPKKEHFYQAQGYIRFLDLQYKIHLTGVIFIYINRESDDMGFKPFWIDRDDTVGDLIENKLAKMKQYLELGEIAPIPPGYNPEDDTNYDCKYCPFREICKGNKTKITDFPGANIKFNLQIPNSSI